MSHPISKCFRSNTYTPPPWGLMRVQVYLCHSQLKGRFGRTAMSLSPPVRMHGGYICVTFCMSVTRPKFTRLQPLHLWSGHYQSVPEGLTEEFRNSGALKICPPSASARWMSGATVLLSVILKKVPNKGRWAHFNVKLHFN